MGQRALPTSTSNSGTMPRRRCRASTATDTATRCSRANGQSPDRSKHCICPSGQLGFVSCFCFCFCVLFLFCFFVSCRLSLPLGADVAVFVKMLWLALCCRCSKRNSFVFLWLWF